MKFRVWSINEQPFFCVRVLNKTEACPRMVRACSSNSIFFPFQDGLSVLCPLDLLSITRGEFKQRVIQRLTCSISCMGLNRTVVNEIFRISGSYLTKFFCILSWLIFILLTYSYVYLRSADHYELLGVECSV